MSTSDFIIDDISKDGNLANVIYSEPPNYTVQSTEPINYSDTHTQVHQPQSSYNINSSSPSSNPNRNITQSTNEINSYTAWSIINIICCCNICFGCLALHYSIKTEDLKGEGLVQNALITSKVARNINTVITMLGLFIDIIL
ncbi:unnamed protein product [Adineta steineri]|uniref:Interferon-induced transmembrane protein n=1 Tax=Adineta steineri TaxID=433720 RepID=A0A819Y9Q7_9BILA|nr:unnamed protein product [Adineta steineri]CAF4146422.1 unnamed protein product [Adineta steineri]